MVEPDFLYRFNIKESSSRGKYIGGSGWSSLMQCAIEEETRPLHIYDSPLCSINSITKSVGHSPHSAGMYSYPYSYNAARPSKSNTLNQNTVASRSKKRKASIFSQSPWRKVVLHGSESCHSISVSEEKWALATNRLCEKDDPSEGIPRTKRRLVLSTHLIQQLLQPAPTFVLSGAFNYETLLYFVSRIALADACSLKWTTNLQTSMIASNNEQDQDCSSLVKGFMEKMHKLESDFQRLEKTASIVDIYLEIQDLERFYVINHLAKFHRRTKTGTRSVPRKHVIGIKMPMPENLLEPLHCLPL